MRGKRGELTDRFLGLGIGQGFEVYFSQLLAASVKMTWFSWFRGVANDDDWAFDAGD
jgi:hypothetical protein